MSLPACTPAAVRFPTCGHPRRRPRAHNTHTHTHTHTTLPHPRQPKTTDERVSTDLKKQIVAARTAKKLTQAQLGQLINEKPQIIQEYEW